MIRYKPFNFDQEVEVRTSFDVSFLVIIFDFLHVVNTVYLVNWNLNIDTVLVDIRRKVVFGTVSVNIFPVCSVEGTVFIDTDIMSGILVWIFHQTSEEVTNLRNCRIYSDIPFSDSNYRSFVSNRWPD